MLRPVPTAEIELLLISRGLTPDRADLLARLAQGAPGWAITAIDHEEVLTQRTERMEKLLHLINRGYEERFEVAEELTGKGAQGRTKMTELIREWQSLWRDLLFTKTEWVKGIVNLDYQDKIVTLGEKMRSTDIRAFLTSLTQAEQWVSCNVNSRLILDTLMLDMPLVDKVKLKG
jgi:DNA polymerase-3 subunit delta'